MSQTESQLIQRYVMMKYPCLQSWLDFVNLHTPYAQQFDSTSCAQIAQISRSAMKALDYIVDVESNSSVVRVARTLSTMQEMAWRSWTAFSAQGRIATGTRVIAISSVALEALKTLNRWDSAFEPNPTTFDPSALFDVVLKGVVV